ncbi:Zn-dependent oligopeptidase [Neisseriaceae bacterium JH1-16]|nr:Zn-dependent oligopeptidase [Neisseriaceae bacterium JH1-16]
MIKQWLLAAAVLPIGASAWAAEPMRGAFFQGSGEQVKAQCQQVKSTALAMAARMEAVKPADIAHTPMLAAWNDMAVRVQAMAGPVELLAAVSPDAKVRDASDACTVSLSGLWSELYQKSALYERIRAVKPGNAPDAMARQVLLDNFEAYGVALPAAKRAQFKALQTELDTLATQFNKNVATYKAEPARLTFSAAELAGTDLAALAKFRQPDGRYLVDLSYPVRDNVLGYASNPETRRRFYVEFQNRGGQANIAILQQLSDKRRQQAQLLGYPSYADWTLRTKMAGTPTAVTQFLDKVGGKVTALEQLEIAELAALKRADGDAAPFKRWDQTYYQNRLKKAKYQLDQAEVRRQFPTEASVNWVLLVSSRLYGVSFKENRSLPRWNKEVKAFDVFEGRDGRGNYLGSFYLDLYPRENKYGHAAAFGVRNVSHRAGVTPVSVLVTNFDRVGLDSDELETLFHEFGHVLHGVLSNTRDSVLGGTNVKQDFVEAPSQMYEEWARRPESLKVFSEACPSCKPIDPALIAKMNNARRFGKGLQYARQRLYAQFDMALVGPQVTDVMGAWSRLEGATPLGYDAGTLFPAGFGHLAGGYAAGYYGYMWSEVLALDMLSGFGKNVMDPVAGQRYRRLILQRGGEVAPTRMVTDFLGRAPNEQAFFDEITGQRGL